MIQPEDKELRALAHVAQNVPAVVEWLDKWYRTELDRLPQTLNNAAVAQGRCQVLGELHKVLTEAPELVAQPPTGQHRA